MKLITGRRHRPARIFRKGREDLSAKWSALLKRDKAAFCRRLWRLSAVPLASCVLLLTVIAVLQIDLRGSATVAAGGQEPVILLDPGHGGADGGAVAADGTQEKDINLAIALSLRDMLTVCGYRVDMTRTEDISIHSPDCTTLREQKVGDMKNRLKLYETAALVVGIHQNKFEIPKYHGTQIFYSANNAMSKVLADSIRESVLTRLQPENTRELKKADKNIFLLDKTQVPAALVECGFLSNPEELAKLKSENYQQQMAFAIACGILAYME